MNAFLSVTETGHDCNLHTEEDVLSSVLDLRRHLCVALLFLGYDSDVAREKVVDYITKIYSASIRNMSGTKPHLQHKELPVEER